MPNVIIATVAIIVTVPCILGLIVMALMWRAWWLHPAWTWFVVPLGAPSISFWHFTALMLLFSVFTYHDDGKKDDRKTDWGKIVVGFLWPMIAWLILRWMKVPA